MKVAYAALFVLLSMLIVPLPSNAQGAPDVVFSVSYYNPAGVLPTASQVPASSWTNTYTNTSGTNTKTATVSGAVTGSDLEATTIAEISASGTSLVQMEANQRVLVYVRGRASADVTVVHDAEVSIISGSNDTQFVGYTPGHWGFGNATVTTTASGTSSTSMGETKVTHYDPACNASTTTFPAYPGVVYTLTDGSTYPRTGTLLRTDGGGDSRADRCERSHRKHPPLHGIRSTGREYGIGLQSAPLRR